jgi:hypothetical protein
MMEQKYRIVEGRTISRQELHHQVFIGRGATEDDAQKINDEFNRLCGVIEEVEQKLSRAYAERDVAFKALGETEKQEVFDAWARAGRGEKEVATNGEKED